MSQPVQPEFPFSEADLVSARERLEESGFPLTGQAEALRLIEAGEPFLFYTLAAGECLRALQQLEDPRRLVKSARRAADVVDRIAKWMGSSLEDERGKSLKLACKAGCHYCCSIRVNALSAEIASITEFIESHFSAEERDRTLGEVSSFVDRASLLTPKERFFKPALCPLNKDGLCTVYDVRPMACRSHHSYSVEQCRVSFEEWSKNRPITRSAMRKLCGEAVVAALIDVLDFIEIDPRELELAEALQVAMSSESLTERLARGEDVFSIAYKPAVSRAGDFQNGP